MTTEHGWHAMDGVRSPSRCFRVESNVSGSLRRTHYVRQIWCKVGILFPYHQVPALFQPKLMPLKNFRSLSRWARVYEAAVDRADFRCFPENIL